MFQAYALASYGHIYYKIKFLIGAGYLLFVSGTTVSIPSPAPTSIIQTGIPLSYQG